MLGKYSAEAIKEMTTERTEKGTNLIKKFGWNLVDALILLGDYDLALIVEVPGISEAVQISVSLSKYMGISFQTYPAIPVAEFDKMLPSMK
jgi:uncharacterized protein with GYD domain